MSFKISNTSQTKTLITNNDCPPIFNYETIVDYLSKVYANGNLPNLKDFTFVWGHIAGDLDNWAKNGLAGVKSTFRWGNQNLPQPKIILGANVLPTGLAGNLEIRDQITEIIDTLPQKNQLWTPDYYMYPQIAINRFNPRWWNQFYFDWNVTNGNVNLTNSQIKSAIITNSMIIEGSNTGGPDTSSGQTFFYLATGSGMKFTIPTRSSNQGGACVALNKMHAYVIGIAYSLFPNSIVNGAELSTTKKIKVIQTAVKGLVNVYSEGSNNNAFPPDTFLGGNSPVVTTTTFLQSINDALYSPSGYFSLPGDSPTVSATNAPGTNELVNNLLWNPLRAAYPEDSLTQPEQTMWALVCFLCGLKPYTLPTSNIIGTIANPLNSELNASNCCDGVLEGTQSSAASQPYEYLAQVATNLTIADNFLDQFVTLVSQGSHNAQEGLTTAGSFMNVSAVINLSQWNSLGGWTTEIPCNPPVGSVGNSSPVITSSNGYTLLGSTDNGNSNTPTWWNADSSDVSILGINDYEGESTNFTIPVVYL